MRSNIDYWKSSRKVTLLENPVVGWAPISAARLNSLVNQAKTARAADDKEDGKNLTTLLRRKLTWVIRQLLKRKGVTDL
ncbi:hypothetical protein ACE6H2_016942 [Prunus campanulata]